MSQRRTLRALVLTGVLVAGAGLGVGYVRRGAVQPPGPEGARGQPPTLSSSVAPTPSASVEPPPTRSPPTRLGDDLPAKLDAQRERLFSVMKRELGLSAAELARVRSIFDASPVLGQGNPTVTRHPMKRSECWDIRQRAGLHSSAELALLAERETTCGDRFMAPIGREGSRTVCIDQYEFPNVPCEYPVVFSTAKESADLCRAVGKRLCDAHEWEGACAGELRPAEKEYLWDRKRRIEMEYFKNQDREIRWAYGPKKDHQKCATNSAKSDKCGGGGWDECGSNTFPAGAFPQCVSPLGVYDQHGNAAEHMNLPMKPEELSSRGGLGETEMKGSWFIFLRGEAHEDDCRWRAPAWHSGRVSSPTSHLNYHLGFRCCKDVP